MRASYQSFYPYFYITPARHKLDVGAPECAPRFPPIFLLLCPFGPWLALPFNCPGNFFFLVSMGLSDACFLAGEHAYLGR